MDRIRRRQSSDFPDCVIALNWAYTAPVVHLVAVVALPRHGAHPLTVQPGRGLPHNIIQLLADSGDGVPESQRTCGLSHWRSFSKCSHRAPSA